ncbi:ATP-binding response regulator [Uliginosibacterium sp. H1]|uniref:ATP-binding response regulator n=1 Tax=Uliginosibacterium sp. H1 TaxID=3114757 RepID=UPI002E17ADE1|nr:ATP-binding protein [Uliginosibacterium sp. H1]
MIPILTARIANDSDIFSGRRRARQIATMLELDDNHATRLATAVSEIARNALQHAGSGRIEFVLARLPQTNAAFLMAKVIDDGPGIKNVEQMLRSPSNSAHMGIAGSRRLVDEFVIEARPGGGTTVTLKMALAPRYARMTPNELQAFVDDLIRRHPTTLIEELEQQNREMMVTLDQLLEHQQQLREQDRRKDEFMAILAHELRNPLAAISNALNLQQHVSGKELPPEQAIIKRQTLQLRRLVDDLLEASRFTLGKLQIHRTPVRVGEIASQAVEACESIFNERSQHFHMSLPKEDLWVDADQARLSQALGNLLHNAAKFTPMGGRIHLDVWSEAGQIILSVRDNGIGIDPTSVSGLFRLFNQGNQPAALPSAGLGIGLSVAENLVRLHDGRIDVLSEGANHGSEFRITLDLIAAPVEPQKEPTVPAEPAVEAPSSASGSRILLVDDNMDAARTMAELFNLLGHETATVFDGESAIARFKQWMPEVVVLDIGLPDISGLDVAKAIRSETDTAQPMLIALTGFSHDAARKAIVDAGFDHYLVKPAMPDELLDIITRRTGASALS